MGTESALRTATKNLAEWNECQIIYVRDIKKESKGGLKSISE